MAKLHEEILIVKLSKLVKEGAPLTAMFDNTTLESIEQVVQELVGLGVVVEVEKA